MSPEIPLAERNLLAMTVHEGTVQASAAATRLQFGLRGIFATMTLAALALSLVVLAPDSIAGSVILILSVSLPVALTIVVIYGRGIQRTFCIGALIPTGGVFISISFAFVIFLLQPGGGPGPDTLIEMTEQMGKKGRGFASASWALAFILGVLAVTIRLWVDRYRSEARDKGP